jgi:glycosyltransferase involved in cell wall biosynthesis
MRGVSSLTASFRLWNVVRRNRIDLIHAHLTRATYLSYFAGMFGNIPFVSTTHTEPHDVAYRFLPGRNHWLVAVSDYIRNSLIARGLPANRVYTVHNGSEFADDSWTYPKRDLSVCAELGLPVGAEIIGLVGRVRPVKGHHLLIEAARDIVQTCPKAYFVFVGPAEPGAQQALWEMAAKWGVEDRLRFTGVRNDISRLMDAMEIVTLPSVIESFGMVIIEAMAMGKPVVATSAGGVPEIIEHNKTGLIVERTSGALKDAITTLLRDPRTRAAMGKAGQERARSLFSAGTMAQNMEAVYQTILTSRH